jgi:hypothetical protein
LQKERNYQESRANKADYKIERLKEQVEKCKSEMTKIPYRCGWYEGIGLECINKDPHKINYCPCTICPRYEALEAIENSTI